MATPVVIVTAGGIAATETPNGTPLTPVTDRGFPITLVAAGGLPVHLVNVDGSAYSVGPDVTAPTIATPSAISWPENSAFTYTLSANEVVTWTKTGGADAALFTLVGNTLSMVAKDYETPADADGNNTYVVQVTATDGVGNAANQTITVTITNVVEAAPPIDVALFMGQSNSTGTQADYSKPVGFSASSNILAFDGTSLLTYNPGSANTGLEAGSPEASWAADLQYVINFKTAFPSRKLVVLRFNARGTSLATQWLNSGGLLSQAATYFTNAMAALVTAGYAPTVRIVDWMQGESDAGNTTDAGNYATNLATLVATLRNSSGAWAIPSSAPFAIGRISDLPIWTYRSSVRAAEASLAAADVGGPQWMYDTDDLPIEGDGMHYTNAGQITRGDRVWAVDQGTYVLPADTTPDAFSFTAVSSATLSTDYTSNTITVAGLDSGASVSVLITGGSYSKNGGSFTSAAGVASNGDTFAVKKTSSASNSASVSASLVIGGVTGTYTVTTVAAAGGVAQSTTWNPAKVGAYGTLANSNRDFVGPPTTSNHFATVLATSGLSTGKKYIEFKFTAVATGAKSIGIGVGTAGVDLENFLGAGPSGAMIWFDNQNNFANSLVIANTVTPGSVVLNDVWALAIDADSQKIWIAKNNVWQTGDPTTGASPWATFTSTGFTLYPAATIYSPDSVTLSIPATAVYAAPTGFSVF